MAFDVRKDPEFKTLDSTPSRCNYYEQTESKLLSYRRICEKFCNYLKSCDSLEAEGLANVTDIEQKNKLSWRCAGCALNCSDVDPDCFVNWC